MALVHQAVKEMPKTSKYYGCTKQHCINDDGFISFSVPSSNLAMGCFDLPKILHMKTNGLRVSPIYTRKYMSLLEDQLVYFY